MGGICSCFDGEDKYERREQERLASEEARAKAAEAAQRRQQDYEQSAIGRATRAHAAKEKQQAMNPNKGEPALKVLLVMANGLAHNNFTLQVSVLNPLFK
ncbi:Starch synthase 3 chloroplastic/amyloplastic [Bienertia sinuspersici]